MNYTQIGFKLTPDSQENREILVAMLENLPFESFDETEEKLMGYIPGEDFDINEIDQVTELLPFSIEKELEIIPDKNWNEVWEKNYFKPLIIDGHCLIRAPFHTDYPKAEFELIIEPKMAFGTGNHETTTLVSNKILNFDLTGKTVLDMGCGTGILGMLASLKGALSVTAIDIDSWSYESTLENAKINHITNLEAFLGDAALLKEQQFDVIFANIHKNVILNDLPRYFEVLKPAGIIFLSGFYTHDMPDIKQKAESVGFAENSFDELNNWVVYIFNR